MLAHRMAQLLKEPCGQTVGYQIDMSESQLNSKIIVMTEGFYLGNQMIHFRKCGHCDLG